VIINPDINIQAIWWQVIPVLVFNQSDWPQENGSSGITSEHALRVAEEARDRRPKYRFEFLPVLQFPDHRFQPQAFLNALRPADGR